MGQPAARVTDMQTCPMVTGIVPHVGGPITLGCFTVLTSGLPQARIGDMHHLRRAARDAGARLLHRAGRRPAGLAHGRRDGAWRRVWSAAARPC